MIQVAVEVKERTLDASGGETPAPDFRAFSKTGKGRPDREIRLVFPIESERFFAGDEVGEPLGRSSGWRSKRWPETGATTTEV